MDSFKKLTVNIYDYYKVCNILKTSVKKTRIKAPSLVEPYQLFYIIVGHGRYQNTGQTAIIYMPMTFTAAQTGNDLHVIICI
jgi:hypothetical protein